MALLLLKLTLTPLLIGGSSLAARRWGPAVGGWLIALPLTSGPIALYLALEHGPAFAASAADGSLGGLLGNSLFALGYATVAGRGPWPVSLAAGIVGYLAAAISVQPLLGGPVVVLLGAVLLGMVVAYRLTPSPNAVRRNREAPSWDISARVVVGTVLVLAITGAASGLGPHASGIFATFPVYATVLAVFAHRLDGPSQAIGVLRGLQFGLFGTTLFLTVLALGLEPLGIAAAFALGLVALFLVHGALLTTRRRLRRRQGVQEAVTV